MSAGSAEGELVGRSVQGRAIVAKSWGDRGAERKVLVVGSIHGNETQGQRIVKRLEQGASTAARLGFASLRLEGRRGNRLRGVELVTVKTVNPDGVAANTRGNAHAVDLNRNFDWSWRPIPQGSGYYSGPSPASEPETQAVSRLLRRLRPEVTIWYHQPWGETLIPCDRRGRRVALLYARLSGLRPRDCFPSPPGSATGYQGSLRQRAFGVELTERPLRAHEVRRHARAVLEIAAPG